MTKRAPDYSYSSSVLANAVNITTEGLRYYEKQGVGQSLRKDNGYRVYHPQEVPVLRFVRNFNAYGFSLKESIDMVTSKIEIGDLEDALLEKQLSLQKKIWRNQAVLMRLNQHINAVQYLKESDNRIWFEKQNSFYYLHYGIDLSSHKKEKLNGLMHRWMDLMPIVLPMPVMKLEEYRNKEDPVILGGFAIQEKDLPDDSYLDEEYCRLYPARNYLCTFSRQTELDGITIHEERIQKAFKRIKELNLKLDGDCFFQTVTASEYENTIEIYYKVYLAVTPA